MSLFAATWTGAIPTIGLLIGAAVTDWYAHKAFGEQSAEGWPLQKQAERDIEQRRRDQATRVFASASSACQIRPW
jgi:hypothetical protein